MADPYDFKAFIDRMTKLDRGEILREADAACARTEAASFGGDGPRQREQDSVDYARRIREFSFFMRHLSRPVGAADGDFASYRAVAEALARKGRLKPEILALFDRTK